MSSVNAIAQYNTRYYFVINFPSGYILKDYFSIVVFSLNLANDIVYPYISIIISFKVQIKIIRYLYIQINALAPGIRLHYHRVIFCIGFNIQCIGSDSNRLVLIVGFMQVNPCLPERLHKLRRNCQN